jgi:hypothetical protein
MHYDSLGGWLAPLLTTVEDTLFGGRFSFTLALDENSDMAALFRVLNA